MYSRFPDRVGHITLDGVVDPITVSREPFSLHDIR
jgi:hypothetical protein